MGKFYLKKKKYWIQINVFSNRVVISANHAHYPGAQVLWGLHPESWGKQRRHHSKLNVAAQIDADLWWPSCPLHLYLSLLSGYICKVCPQYETLTTHSLSMTESSPMGAAAVTDRRYREDPETFASYPHFHPRYPFPAWMQQCNFIVHLWTGGSFFVLICCM